MIHPLSETDPFAKYGSFGTGSYQGKSISRSRLFLQSDAEFSRADWSIYIANLPQRAGVPKHQIGQLVLKELVDNALDEMDRVGRPGEVTLERHDENVFTVTDRGRGFDDTPEELAHRFSIAKPMSSSKQWRRPSRGCVGNGLRVIVGSVVTGAGHIMVKTRNREVVLRPRLDGTTAVDQVKPIDWPVGTAITIEIDPAYLDRSALMEWAQLAIQLAQQSGPAFTRKPSPLWLDADHVATNMLAAIGPVKTVAWFVAQLDRCSAREVGQLITERFGKGRLCRDMNKAEAAELLTMLQQKAALIRPKQLGPMGHEAWKQADLLHGYACEEGSFQAGAHPPFGQIPYLVEAWAATCEPDSKNEDDVYAVRCFGLTINRTPALIEPSCYREGWSRNVNLWLGSVDCELSLPKGAYRIALNIASPFIPILGDNKVSHLGNFKEALIKAVEAAVRRSARNCPPMLFTKNNGDNDGNGNNAQDGETPEERTQRDRVLEILARGEAQHKASGGTLEFNQRSLYYVVRESVPGLTASYFAALVTEYEYEHGEIPLMFRTDRGVFYEPHGGEVIPLGTLTVRNYRRGFWRYGTVLVCEKEDNVHMLRQAGIAERFDCFLLSSSGFTTRALKDLIDYIGTTQEPVRMFAMIDGDAHGSMIYQTLVKETKARGARNIEIINLGLFPWEAVAEGLPHETGLAEQRRKKGKARYAPVADYIKSRDLENSLTGNSNNEPHWQTWLQDNRVELNAMTSPQRVAWVERKLSEHNVKKVVPPDNITKQALADELLEEIEVAVKEEALKNVQDWIAREIKKRFEAIQLPSGAELKKSITEFLVKLPRDNWRTVIAILVARSYRQGVFTWHKYKPKPHSQRARISG
jgi:DNA topoisomerase VI subunit B